MATFPDGSQPPEYPETLGGLQTIQQDAVDPENPVGEIEIADAEDVNFIYRNLVRAVEDMRDFIKKFGLDPDDPDLKDMEDAGQAILDAIAGAGGGGPGGFNHISERWYGPQPFDAGEMFGVGTNDCFALPFYVPESGNYDGFGIKSGGESGSVKGYIYDAGDGGKPKIQLKDFGLGSTSGGAIELLSTPVTLPQGSAYMICVFSGLSIQLFRLRTNVPSFLNIPFGSGTFGSETPFYGFDISGASFSSGLPTDISGLSKVQSGTIPIMNLRKD